MFDAAIVVADPLRPVVSLGVLVVEGARTFQNQEPLDSAIREAENRVRSQEGMANLQATRAMYRQTGLDPTRRRPSSEALLRRVLRGENLPRVNTAVDVCNWCSLEFQVPYGLYDLDRVEPPVHLRIGEKGEQYVGIRKDVVHVEGRMTLADRIGPFGNPSADSARTMVTDATSNLLVVIFVPAQVRRQVLQPAIEATSARLALFTGGRETLRAVA
ncbi:MAG: B3/4 domain-containing protein [Vicinamibacterales bacterium]